jgi:hypothetical protein
MSNLYPTTCAEAEEWCKGLCTTSQAGIIQDPDCFRGDVGKERLKQWRDAQPESPLCLSYSVDGCCTCIKPKGHARDFALCVHHGSLMSCTDDFPGRPEAIQSVMLILGDLTEACLDETIAQRLATHIVNQAIEQADPK